jgi:hypothetical protein
MHKFCWSDRDADLTTYIDSMVALEESYPDTKLVYFTMPLSTEKNSIAARRVKFDNELRNWIDAQNNKLFFDLADIESNSPDGVHQTFLYQDMEYENLYPEYTFDEGHLNEAGSVLLPVSIRYWARSQVHLQIHTSSTIHGWININVIRNFLREYL